MGRHPGSKFTAEQKRTNAAEASRRYAFKKKLEDRMNRRHRQETVHQGTIDDVMQNVREIIEVSRRDRRKVINNINHPTACFVQSPIYVDVRSEDVCQTFETFKSELHASELEIRHTRRVRVLNGLLIVGKPILIHGEQYGQQPQLVFGYMILTWMKGLQEDYAVDITKLIANYFFLGVEGFSGTAKYHTVYCEGDQVQKLKRRIGAIPETLMNRDTERFCVSKSLVNKDNYCEFVALIKKRYGNDFLFIDNFTLANELQMIGTNQMVNNANAYIRRKMFNYYCDQMKNLFQTKLQQVHTQRIFENKQEDVIKSMLKVYGESENSSYIVKCFINDNSLQVFGLLGERFSYAKSYIENEEIMRNLFTMQNEDNMIQRCRDNIATFINVRRQALGIKEPWLLKINQIQHKLTYQMFKNNLDDELLPILEYNDNDLVNCLRISMLAHNIILQKKSKKNAIMLCGASNAGKSTIVNIFSKYLNFGFQNTLYDKYISADLIDKMGIIVEEISVKTDATILKKLCGATMLTVESKFKDQQEIEGKPIVFNCNETPEWNQKGCNWNVGTNIGAMNSRIHLLIYNTDVTNVGYLDQDLYNEQVVIQRGFTTFQLLGKLLVDGNNQHSVQKINLNKISYLGTDVLECKSREDEYDEQTQMRISVSSNILIQVLNQDKNLCENIKNLIIQGESQSWSLFHCNREQNIEGWRQIGIKIRKLISDAILKRKGITVTSNMINTWQSFYLKKKGYPALKQWMNAIKTGKEQVFEKQLGDIIKEEINQCRTYCQIVYKLSKKLPLKVDTTVNTTVNNTVNTTVNTIAEQKVETKVETKAETKAETKVQTKVETQNVQMYEESKEEIKETNQVFEQMEDCSYFGECNYKNDCSLFQEIVVNKQQVNYEEFYYYQQEDQDSIQDNSFLNQSKITQSRKKVIAVNRFAQNDQLSVENNYGTVNESTFNQCLFNN